MNEVIGLPPKPGILALFAASPATADSVRQFAHALLRGPSALTEGQREAIAAHVSRANNARFCAVTHAAAAAELAADPSRDPLLAALLDIADHVRAQPTRVPAHLVHRARSAGAGDRAIHDAVLVAAAFSMFNRYVECLGAPTGDTEALVRMGREMALRGYR